MKEIKTLYEFKHNFYSKLYAAMEKKKLDEGSMKTQMTVLCVDETKKGRPLVAPTIRLYYYFNNTERDDVGIVPYKIFIFV